MARSASASARECLGRALGVTLRLRGGRSLGTRARLRTCVLRAMLLALHESRARCGGAPVQPPRRAPRTAIQVVPPIRKSATDAAKSCPERACAQGHAGAQRVQPSPATKVLPCIRPLSLISTGERGRAPNCPWYGDRRAIFQQPHEPNLPPAILVDEEMAFEPDPLGW